MSAGAFCHWGAWESCTVMTCTLVLVFPQESLAVQVRVIV